VLLRDKRLSHVRDDQQRFPYPDGEPDSSPGQRGRDTDKPQGVGRSTSAEKRRRGHLPSWVVTALTCHGM